MKRTLAKSVLCIIILQGCVVPNSTGIRTPKDYPIELTPTHSLLPIKTSVQKTSTLEASYTMLPTQESIIPETKSICPEEREVPISSLEINPSSYLILTDGSDYYNTYHLWYFSGESLEPTKITGLRTKIIPSDFSISPNALFFLYEALEGPVLHYELWIRAIDNSVHRKVLDIDGQMHPRWIRDTQIELWENPLDRNSCPKHVLNVNPFTLVPQEPILRPKSQYPECYLDPLMSPDGSLLAHRATKWSIIDISTGDRNSIFRWLPDDWDQGLSSGLENIFLWTDNGFTILMPDEDSISFVVDLPVDLAYEDENPLKTIQLPEAIVNDHIAWISDDGSLIGIDLGSEDEYVEYSSDPPSRFFILDLREPVLYEFCLDRAVAGIGRGVRGRTALSSTDQRFLAWTIHEPPGLGPPLETIVLNMKTGVFSRLEGFEALGWGEIQQSK
ncbi:MAG: hypothetical protein GTO14_06165 [Anaerolineales bacterium]|nr:hypothetical protein [Anaerolineales bacterium]